MKLKAAGMALLVFAYLLFFVFFIKIIYNGWQLETQQECVEKK